MKDNYLKMRSEFTCLCGVYGRSDFARSKKAFVFADFGDTCCGGTSLIPEVFN